MCLKLLLVTDSNSDCSQQGEEVVQETGSYIPRLQLMLEGFAVLRWPHREQLTQVVLFCLLVYRIV